MTATRRRPDHPPQSPAWRLRLSAAVPLGAVLSMSRPFIGQPLEHLSDVLDQLFCA